MRLGDRLAEDGSVQWSPPLGPGLYLRSNHGRQLGKRDLFRLDGRRGGRAVPLETTTRGAALVLRPRRGSGSIEVVIDGASVRLRGRGIGLRLDAPIGDYVVAYPEESGRWTVNLRPSYRRYLLDPLRGSLAMDAPWNEDRAKRIAATIGADGGPWELAIDEHLSTWVPRRRQAFATVAARQQAAKNRFSASFPAAPRRWAAAAADAGHLLWNCCVPPTGLLRREAVLMSRAWMDAVWTWDNCFNAAALAPAHPQLALDQILIAIDHQDEHGAFPDQICDTHLHYCFAKPPVQGILLEEIARRAPRFLDLARIRALYPGLAAFTRWWLRHRRMPGERLCHYLHGNDSGWDNCSLFRSGTPLAGPDLNTFLAIQCRVLAGLAGRLRLVGEQRRWLRSGRQLSRAVIEELWTGDGFCALRLPQRQQVTGESLVSCLPLLLGTDLPATMREVLVGRIGGLLTAHGLATERPDTPLYRADGYWRGPVWAPSTMLAVIGLEACGETTLAREISRRFCDTVRASGFAENFNAVNGAPLRDPGYTWTAAGFLCLLDRCRP